MPAGHFFALLTDFGTRDAYVGAIKAVILDLVPDAVFIDISHDIGAQDVRHGALVLHDVLPYLPVDTHCVAVVDPGVGSTRRALAVESSERGLRLVGPDNGLLWPAVGARARAVHAIENRAYTLARVSGTFHGRDLFAPAAAHLARGVPVSALGPEVTDMVQLVLPDPEPGDRCLHGEVLYIDTFGNLVTSVQAEDLPTDVAPSELRFSIGGLELRGLQQSYADVPPGALLVTEGGFGRLEVAQNRGSAARHLGVTQHMSYAFDVSW